MGTRIGKYIKHCLESSEALTEATGGRIFPVVEPLDGVGGWPYVIYASDGFTEDGSKDGVYGDTVNVEISVMARSEEELGDVAAMVRQAMHDGWMTWEDDPFSVTDQTLSVGGEDFDLVHDGFYLPMRYAIEIEY